MGVNSLPKTVTRQRRDCDLKPGPSTPESSTLTTRLPSAGSAAAESLSFGAVHDRQESQCVAAVRPFAKLLWTLVTSTCSIYNLA